MRGVWERQERVSPLAQAHRHSLCLHLLWGETGRGQHREESQDDITRKARSLSSTHLIRAQARPPGEVGANNVGHPGVLIVVSD